MARIAIPEPVNGAAPTEDEEQVLAELYGPPGPDGVYRGEGFYTGHGHWTGPGRPTEPRPRLVAKCGGPRICAECRQEAEEGSR